MCPLTRRNCLPASTIPAAHQRSAICPSRQFLTLLACVRQIEIMLSTALVERRVRASVGGMFRPELHQFSDRLRWLRVTLINLGVGASWAALLYKLLTSTYSARGAARSDAYV